jgi:integrase/recombinase XerD
MLCTYALKNDIINKNYAEFVTLPKFAKKEKDRFSDLEVKKIEDAAAKDTPWADTVLILIYTGMRISEMLRLTRFSVDLERQLITGGIKTDAGKDRIVPIHPKIAAYVKKWYEQGGDRLICREDGSGMSADYYRKNYYYDALKAAGVRRLVPHACRHTFGSLAAEAGIEPIYIQLMIGHADYAFTANNYTHPQIEALRKAINKL